MYSLFLDKISGRVFAADYTDIRFALTLLNDKISQTGELNATEYYKRLDLPPLNPAVTYLVFKDSLFQFRPEYIDGVLVTAIDLESYSLLFDDEREEVNYVDDVLRRDDGEVLCGRRCDGEDEIRNAEEAIRALSMGVVYI